ncbi:MAG: A24 family peptidase [Pirellulaceae bacterium]|nr:A24 family peptidase [Pirellulaceae bacterium]
MSTTVTEQHSQMSRLRNSFVSRLDIRFLSIATFSGCVLVAPEFAGWLMGASLAVAMLTASWIDTKTRLIPNRLTYPLILFGVVGNLAMSLFVSDEIAGVVGIEESLKGTGLCFSLMLLLFLSNATGGGDVKLATAIGAFLGPQDGIMAIAWCHVLAGIFVLVWMLSRVRMLQGLRSAWAYGETCILSRRLQPIALNFGSVAHKRIPMAAFFALGVLLTTLGFRLW